MTTHTDDYVLSTKTSGVISLADIASAAYTIAHWKHPARDGYRATTVRIHADDYAHLDCPPEKFIWLCNVMGMLVLTSTGVPRGCVIVEDSIHGSLYPVETKPGTRIVVHA